jgi:pimeloyl-ACP methyl ester carboxylesterase
VEGLPHKEADRSARDLKEFANDYTSTALLVILEVCKISSANIIAESQAAPGAVWMALDHLDKISNVALIGPLGLTAHLLGDSPKSRLRELKRRGFLSALQFAQSPLYDPRNFYLSILVLNVLLFDARWNVSGQKYAVGASHDVRQECRVLAEKLHQRGNTMALILGERDKIFPPHEIRSAIKKTDEWHVSMVILKTSHASLAIRDGKHILRSAVEYVRR